MSVPGRAGLLLDAFGLLVFFFAESQAAMIAVFRSVLDLVLSFPARFFLKKRSKLVLCVCFEFQPVSYVSYSGLSSSQMLRYLCVRASLDYKVLNLLCFFL